VAPVAPSATDDPRAAAWEARFRVPIIVAALAVLPLLALSLSRPHGVGTPSRSPGTGSSG